MKFLVQYATLIAFGASVLVQAQTMRVYPKTSFWADFKVSSVDSIAFANPTNDSLRIYTKSGSNENIALNSIDSVKFVNSDNFTGTYGTLVDSRDGQVYKTVTIGTQVWMAQNLNYGTYIDDGASRNTLQSGAQKFCYSNVATNCNTDGGLYQWHTAMGFASTCASSSCASQISSGNHQGICPVGWHIPKKAEWDALQTYLGGSTVAGFKMKLNNSGNSDWDASTYNNGNSSGFSALPVGIRDFDGGFDFRGDYVSFWEAAEVSASVAYYRILDGNSLDLYRNSLDKTFGFSVRCVRD